MSDCEACSDLQIEWAIRSPGELAKAIRVVAANLADGTLRQGPGQPDFRQVREDGPWDDHIHHRFVCDSCGSAFTLSVETYHGAGGEWRPG